MPARGHRRSSATAPLLILAFALAGLLAAGPASAARPFAPLGQPGPKLTVPKSKLKASLECSIGIRNARKQPVLLLAATGVNSDQNFSWNYERAFEQTDRPFCVSDQPQNRNPGGRDSNLGDIQLRGQYVTYAIRRTHALANRRIATMGHSQGGMVMRWPLRFWPGTRKMVADVIGFAGSNHGTTQAERDCGGCAPANAQQAADSRFIAALNSRAETFRGISYTEIYTAADAVVTPNGDENGSSALRTGKGKITNVATQDVCPNNTADHLSIGTMDPVAYALADDALRHRGPADPSRLDTPALCAEVLQPGANPATVTADALTAAAALAANEAAYPQVDREPRLKRYVFKRR
ncbi:lipase [Thermoleophilia bacterium SCSIO 60948]|nr:lipase [Thermoleophilia bacterium SCSIO 60948]